MICFAITRRMELFLSQKSISEGTRRTIRLVNPDVQPDIEIFFDLIGETPPEPQVLDGFVSGIIFYAMRLDNRSAFMAH